MQLIILFSFLFIVNFSEGQKTNHVQLSDTDLLSKQFHKSIRDSVRSLLPDSSVAVFFSAPERNRSNDYDYPYHQDANFYYLTGLIEPNALLLIFKEEQSIAGTRSNEYLFLQSRDPDAEAWTGKRLGPEGAEAILGISAAFAVDAFDTLEIPFKHCSKIFYLPLPKGAVDDKSEPADLYELIEQFKKKTSFPPANGNSTVLSGWLSSMRSIKKSEEIMLMKKAVGITCDGHIEMMKALQSGMYEYQAQAIGEYVFKKNGSESVGYSSICGGGENSCILHYESNRRKLNANDVLLLDMGAEYHGYSADVTRTLPVSGKFSEEQKLIYQVVYDAQEAGFRECKPGSEFNAPHKAASAVIKKGLYDLGIIKDEKNYRKYFMHGTSHFLGLDVHDVGMKNKLEPGNIITVEPGIYIPDGSPCDPKWWNIGIRIEDDILITRDGYENISANAPRSIEQIEEMMRQKSMYKQPK